MIKKLLLTLGMAGLAAGAYAQATVAFDNIAIPSSPNFINPPFVQINGTNAPNAAGSYTVALYWSSNSVAGGPAIAPGTAGLNLVAQFTPAGPGLPSGKFNATSFTVNGLAGSSTGFFEVIGWNSSAANYAAALGANALIGATPVFSAPTGTAGNTSTTPGELLGWTANLNITAVPEPTTIALGGLGVAALLLFRRRK